MLALQTSALSLDYPGQLLGYGLLQVSSLVLERHLCLRVEITCRNRKVKKIERDKDG
jgi:hypothetical protein